MYGSGLIRDEQYERNMKNSANDGQERKSKRDRILKNSFIVS